MPKRRKKRIEDYAGIEDIPFPRRTLKESWSSAEKRGLYLFKTRDKQTWFGFRYTRPDGTGERTLTVLDAKTLPEAYAEATENISLVRAGKDPVENRRRRRQRALQRSALGGALSVPLQYRFGALIIEWLDALQARGRSPGTVKTYRGSVRKYLVPEFGPSDVRNITWPEAEAFLRGVAQQNNTTAAASQAMSTLRSFYSYLVERDIVTHNPFLGRKTTTAKLKVPPRKRVLSDEELHKFLTELDDRGLPSHVRMILLVQLMLPLRVGEVVSFEWEDIDFEKGTIKHGIKGSDGKKTATSVLPLRLMEMFLQWEAETDGGKGRIFDESLDTVRVGHVVKKKLSHWIDFTTHDLRRTASSHLQRMGCPEEVRRAIRNQKTLAGASSKHYDHDEMLEMQFEWLDKWHDRLDALRVDPQVFSDTSKGDAKRRELLARYRK